jgi:hypothetical protein
VQGKPDETRGKYRPRAVSGQEWLRQRGWLASSQSWWLQRQANMWRTVLLMKNRQVLEGPSALCRARSLLVSFIFVEHSFCPLFIMYKGYKFDIWTKKRRNLGIVVDMCITKVIMDRPIYNVNKPFKTFLSSNMHSKALFIGWVFARICEHLRLYCVSQ